MKTYYFLSLVSLFMLCGCTPKKTLLPPDGNCVISQGFLLKKKGWKMESRHVTQVRLAVN